MKCHRAPRARAVRADAHAARRDRLVRPEESRDEQPCIGDLGGPQSVGPAADHLRVQERPCGIVVRPVRIPAGETGRLARHDQRSDAEVSWLERHRQVGGVVTQMTGELDSGGRALHQDHRHAVRGGGVDERDPLIREGLADSVFAATVGDPDVLDPRRAVAGVSVDQKVFDASEQPSRVLPRCPHPMRDHIE
ncbi:hypothetical protein D7252_11600 [Microbacterium sp. CGR2]|nr:hypothetical protein D7252_11600 [Microbacterium sp. CGR2]